MLATRQEHLAWCKGRALQLLDSGDLSGAVASMLSDIEKAEKPLYSSAVITTLTMDGMLFRKTSEQVRDWIEGFN